MLAADGEPVRPSSTTRRRCDCSRHIRRPTSTSANLVQAEGKLDEAATLYAVALRVQPGVPDGALQPRADVGAAGEDRGGGQRVHGGVARVARLREAHNSLGAAFQAQGNLERAIAEYDDRPAVAPRLCRGALQPGGRHCGAGASSTDAVEYYETALRLRPDYPEAHVDLGNVLRAQGERDQAIAHYEAALQAAAHACRSPQQSRRRLGRAGTTRRGHRASRTSRARQARLSPRRTATSATPSGARGTWQRPSRSTKRPCSCGRRTPRRTTISAWR